MRRITKCKKLKHAQHQLHSEGFTLGREAGYTISTVLSPSVKMRDKNQTKARPPKPLFEANLPFSLGGLQPVLLKLNAIPGSSIVTPETNVIFVTLDTDGRDFIRK